MVSEKEIIKKAQEVINIEMQGMKELKGNIDESFVKVCKLLKACKGSVILTGMGKSGYIAHKIAATMSSTGTPAFYVHPAEAIHGDLGMIRKEDVIIAISNSGNTVELEGIIKYAISGKIPLVSITANSESILAKASTYCLLLPKAPEACILGLAPTTSTTLSLVLGDALAVTLLELKEFTPEDFSKFHPGGSLGAKLSKVNDVMHTGKEIPLVYAGTNMAKAIIAITAHKFGCAGILNKNGEIIGVITDGDIRRSMDSKFLTKNVEEVMNPKVIAISSNSYVTEALALMEKYKITILFIIENKKPKGIIHMHDLINLGAS